MSRGLDGRYVTPSITFLCRFEILTPSRPKILTATPVRALQADRGGHEMLVSNLGLLHKLTGAAAVLSTVTELAESGARARIETLLKALGVWGVWASHGAPQKDKGQGLDVDRDILVLLEGRVVPRSCVRVSASPEGLVNASKEMEEAEERAGEVVCVDIQKAWNEMDLKDGYSNIVRIEMFLAFPSPTCRKTSS